MSLTQITLENVGPFTQKQFALCSGINVLSGGNGSGKTQILKWLYSAVQAANPGNSFQYKATRVFRPEGDRLSKLVNWDAPSNALAKVEVCSEEASISVSFSADTPKWEAKEICEQKWAEEYCPKTCVFIPAVNMLPNAWNLEQAVRQRNVMFDDTYLDIIAAAKIVMSQDISNHADSLLLELENAIGGKVIARNERFYVIKDNNVRIELNMLAEGLQKLAVLYLLLKKGTLKNGSVLFWDNPDTGISLKYISLITKILWFLQQEGVQIFVATHSIFLPPALEALTSDMDAVQYYDLTPTVFDFEKAFENERC